jgi:site-specific recombinase XerD
MTSRWTGFRSALGSQMEAFLAQKRALGCRFRNEESPLRLLDRFLVERHVATIDDVTPAVIDAFLASRPRAAPHSYNQLLGIVTRLFDWLVAHEVVPHSPVHAKPRRTTACRLPFLFDPPTARRLLEAAGTLPNTQNTRRRGPTYRTIFALLYGLGLRVGEVARLRISDVDLARQVLVVRETKFAKSRLVPFGPRMGQVVAEYLDRRTPTPESDPSSGSAPAFSFRKGQPLSPCTISTIFSRARASPRVDHPRWHETAHRSLSAPLVCRQHAVAVVSQRCRSRVAVAPALDVSGSRQSPVNRGVPDHHDGAPDRSQSAI